jgi:hypothetical protein
METAFPLADPSISGQLLVSRKTGRVPYHYEIFQASQQRAAGLPTHLAHALLDEFAIAIHVVGPTLQRQRQNGGEPGRLFPVNIQG